jgi:hypothetical protein
MSYQSWWRNTIDLGGLDGAEYVIGSASADEPGIPAQIRELIDESKRTI